MSIAMVVCAMVAVFAASAENDAPVRRLSEMVVGIGMQNLLKMPGDGIKAGFALLPDHMMPAQRTQ